MEIQILMDNVEGRSVSGVRLRPEWGFAAFIEFNGKKILLDSGASAKFASNASAMGIDLSKVDCGVLSHAHFDHSNGLAKFFELNRSALFYMQSAVQENCYHAAKLLKFFKLNVYIGIRRGWLNRYKDRIKFVDGDAEILPKVFLVSHKDCVLNAEGRAAIGQAIGQFVKEHGTFRPDSYDHEQSLVFETLKGLFIMNSCCHGGADNIVKEVQTVFPGKQIYAILGGFHLYKTSKEKVCEFAERLRDLNVQKIYTGHCTGKGAFETLREILGERVEQMSCGMKIEV